MELVNQRGNSTGISGGGYYACDRFKLDLSGAGTWSISQDTDAPDGFGHSYKLDCTTANASLSSSSYFIFQYRPEGQDLQHLEYGLSIAKSVTISFWIKSNLTGTYHFNLLGQGATSKQIGKSYTIDTADTWEYKTITFEGDTSVSIDNDSGAGLLLEWWLAGGTNYTSGTTPTVWENYSATNRAADLDVNIASSTSNYLNITGVQLEVGNVATPFEHESYETTLRKCQRYFYSALDDNVTSGWPIVNVNAYSNNNNYGVLEFPVEMRAAPSMTYSAAGDFRGRMSNSTTCTTVNTQGTHQKRRVCMYFQSTSAAGNGGWIETNNSNAKLQFNAEL
jgi:hypothetical protein